MIRSCSFSMVAPVRLLLLLLLATLTACKADIDFTVEQKVDNEGNDYATLSWNVQPIGSITPTRVTLEPGFGDVDFTDSVDVFPTETTRYTLTVFAEFEDGGIANTLTNKYVYVGPRVNYDLITDTNLRACTEGTGFTHIEQFDSLICMDMGIDSVQGIGQLTDLKVVTLDLNNISDFATFADLEQVHTLSLSNNNIGDLSSFPYMPALTNLVLFNNSIENVLPLSVNPQLQNLAINNNQISDAYQFLGVINVTNLSIAGNEIEDITPIGNLTALQNLDARNNRIETGVWDLRTLENAALIDLRGNGGVKCLEYANLFFILGTAVLFDECEYPPPEAPQD